VGIPANGIKVGLLLLNLFHADKNNARILLIDLKVQSVVATSIFGVSIIYINVKI
jgi:hypothetical protein